MENEEVSRRDSKSLRNATTAADKVSVWIVCFLVILVALVVQLAVYWDNDTSHSAKDLPAFIGALVGLFVYVWAQEIIDSNFFIRATIVSVIILTFDLIRCAVMAPNVPVYHHFTVFASLIPIFYLVFFRSLMLIIFPEYLKTNGIPVVPFYSRGGSSSWRGKDAGYRLTQREKIFGVLLFAGLWIIILGIVFADSIFLKWN
jgi:hypothetical protein